MLIRPLFDGHSAPTDRTTVAAKLTASRFQRGVYPAEDFTAYVCQLSYHDFSVNARVQRC